MRIIVFLIEHLVSHLDSKLLTYIYIYKAIVFYSQTEPNLSMHPAAVTVIVLGRDCLNLSVFFKTMLAVTVLLAFRCCTVYTQGALQQQTVFRSPNQMVRAI